MTTRPPVPSIFRNCSNIYIPNKDAIYLNCTILDGSDPCYLLREVHRALQFQTYFLALIPAGLSIFAFILNILYLIAQVKCFRLEKPRYSAKKQKKNPGVTSFQKRQIFLISRSVAIILVNFLFYVLIIVWLCDGFHYTSAMIFMFLACISFVSVTGTYITLTILLYVAIVHHLWHKNGIAIKHCCLLILAIWSISVVASFGVAFWGATLFYPDSAPISCPFDSCQKPLAIVIVVVLAICYSTVLGMYISMMMRVHLLVRKSSMVKARSNSNSMSAMKVLGLNMLTFAVGTIPILVVCIIALANLESLSVIGEGDKTDCKMFLQSPLFVEVEMLASIAAIVWLIAMIIDPIINLIGDKKMRSFVWGMVSKLSPRLRNVRKVSISKSTISTDD